MNISKNMITLYWTSTSVHICIWIELNIAKLRYAHSSPEKYSSPCSGSDKINLITDMI